MTAPAQDFTFSRQGRSGRAMLAVILWLALLAALGLYLHAALWLLMVLALPLLPALWELWRNPASSFILSQDCMDWSTGSQQASAQLADVTKVRFDTRWDFSVRVTLILHAGRKLRLPPQVLPAHRQFETELQLRGVKTERHHFVVI
ncbi:MAG: hypothetical protein COB16_00130 [Rhodobacteraceae bacterium]|nr:MAG: hypothetical protein COB16_00130 [Paracoccaceae bacterium]